MTITEWSNLNINDTILDKQNRQWKIIEEHLVDPELVRAFKIKPLDYVEGISSAILDGRSMNYFSVYHEFVPFNQLMRRCLNDKSESITV